MIPLWPLSHCNLTCSGRYPAFYPQIQWALFTGGWSSWSIRLQLHSLTFNYCQHLTCLSAFKTCCSFYYEHLKYTSLTPMNVWSHLYKTLQESPLNMAITFTNKKHCPLQIQSCQDQCLVRKWGVRKTAATGNTSSVNQSIVPSQNTFIHPTQ